MSACCGRSLGPVLGLLLALAPVVSAWAASTVGPTEGASPGHERTYIGPMGVTPRAVAPLDDRVQATNVAGTRVRKQLPSPPQRPVRPLEKPPSVEPFRAVQVRPVLDISIALGIAAPTLALGLWVEPSLPRGEMPEPGTEPDVSRLDHVALGRFSKAPNIAADVLVGVSVAAPLVYHAIEAAVHRRGSGRVRGRGFFARYGTDLIIFAQAMAVNAMFTQILKSAVRRPRPYTYLDPESVDPAQRERLMHLQDDVGATWSFPSGHTSAAFAASTAGATLLTLELLGRANWAIVAAWLGGTAVAATTAAMRTLSGKHFPSDVITGALVGAASGAVVPLAHWRPARRGDWAGEGRAPTWAITTFTRPGGGGIGVVGNLPPWRATHRLLRSATDR